MTARLLGSWEPHSPEWHEARAGRIGGSDIAAVCGWQLPGYDDRDALLAKKAGTAPERKTSDAMRRGQWDEAGVLAMLCDTTGATLDPDASTATWQHPEHDGLIYNPDGITTAGVLFEAKSVTERSGRNGWGKGGPSRPGNGDGVPLAYRAQCVYGLGLLGLAECQLGVRYAYTTDPDEGEQNARNYYARYVIQFEPNAYAYMVKRALAFLDDLHQLTKESNAA